MIKAAKIAIGGRIIVDSFERQRILNKTITYSSMIKKTKRKSTV